jgi:hypothetical protein
MFYYLAYFIFLYRFKQISDIQDLRAHSIYEMSGAQFRINYAKSLHSIVLDYSREPSYFPNESSFLNGFASFNHL